MAISDKQTVTVVCSARAYAYEEFTSKINSSLYSFDNFLSLLLTPSVLKRHLMLTTRVPTIRIIADMNLLANILL